MVYNAAGEVLRPFFAHRGNIPNAVLSYFDNHFGFCKTKDRDLDQNILIEVCKYIKQ